MTEEQRQIIIDNIKNYYDSRCGDPHNELAIALGVTRNEAKTMLYRFQYTEDAWFPRMSRRSHKRESIYLDRLGLHGAERVAVMVAVEEEADSFVSARELRRQNNEITEIIEEDTENLLVVGG